MFKNLPGKFKVGRSKIVLISVISILTLINLTVVPYLTSWANAGTFTSASLTLSDSRAGLASVSYAFAFTTTATTSIKQLNVLLCTTASGGCSTPGGLVSTAATISSDNIAGTTRVNTFGVSGTLTTVITTPATQSTQAVTITYAGITNSTTVNTTFYARITTYSDTGTTVIDTATIASATLDTTSIAVTASVDPTFTFTVAAASGTVNSATTNITTTATTIPFGTIVSATPKIGAHNITIATNALHGYVVTAKVLADPPLADASNNIDKFTGTCATPTTWSSPAGTAGNVNTGFFGWTTEDTDLSGYQSNKWAGTTTATCNLLSQAASVSGGTETVKIGWEAEINAIQPPGAYTGTVILVATPTY